MITDLGILEPDPVTKELTLFRHSSGRDGSSRWSTIGWPIKNSPESSTAPPVPRRWKGMLRDLNARTKRPTSNKAARVMAEAYICDYIRTPIGRFRRRARICPRRRPGCDTSEGPDRPQPSRSIGKP